MSATAHPTAVADLFPGSAYDLPIPKDRFGHKADKLAVAISGSIELDRTDTDDLDLIRRLEATDDQDVTLNVTFEVSGDGWTRKRDDDGIMTRTYRVNLKAHTIET